MRRIVSVAAGMMLAGTPLAALAEDGADSAEAAATDAADDPYAGLDPETAALAGEIAALAQSDTDGDPNAVMANLLDLEQRVLANGRMPPFGLGELYSLLAVGAFGLQDYEGALVYLEQAAGHYGAAGIAQDKLAQTQNNRATIYRRLGRLGEAENAAKDALRIRRDLYGPSHQDIASSMHSLANVYFSQGRYHEAIAVMREAVAMQFATTPTDYRLLVLRLDGLASVLNEAGYDLEAIDVARQSFDLARAQLGPEHAFYSLSLNTLGINLVAANFNQEAIPILQETLRLRAATYGRDHPWTASTMILLGTALEQTGALEEAVALKQDGAAILFANPGSMDQGTLAGVHYSLARIPARQEDWDAYDPIMQAGIAAVDENLPETHPARAWLHVFHAYNLEQRGFYDQALEIAEKWVPVLVASNAETSEQRLIGEMLLARLRQRAGEPSNRWLPQADNAASRFDDVFSDLGTSDRSLAKFGESVRGFTWSYFDMALAMKDDARIFRASQMLSLTDLSIGQARIGEGKVEGNVEGKGPAADGGGARDMHRELLGMARRESELERRRALLLKDEDVQSLRVVESELAGLRQQRIDLSARLRSDYPEYEQQVRPAAISLAQVQARLAPQDILIIPIESDRGGWIVRITHDTFAMQPFDSAAARSHVASIRASVEPAPDGALPPFAMEDAWALYRMMFPQGIPEGSRLLVHGGQSLASLPFGLLLTAPWDGRLADAPWLVKTASVQVVGNLSLLDRGDAGDPRPVSVSGGFAGIGGVEMPGMPGALDAPEGVQLAGLFRSGRPLAEAIASLPPLPEAQAELAAIARLLSGGNDLLLLGPDAAEENFKRADLSGYSVIAFATHGLVAGELRGLWEPALLLGTGEGSGEDGLLGASEIAQLRLDADLVILSACNTAAGLDGQAPVYSGLATSFAQAGARSLMLSHWRVRDDAAARLTVGTVEGMVSGLSRPEALRRSQLSLMADDGVPDAAHPAIWAPFVIIEN